MTNIIIASAFDYLVERAVTHEECMLESQYPIGAAMHKAATVSYQVAVDQIRADYLDLARLRKEKQAHA